MEFPAKCPRCDDGSCGKCDDNNQIAVTLDENDTYYTEHCLNPDCGFDNGGCSSRFLDRRDCRPCIMCKHPETTMIPMCESSENPPWIEKQRGGFADYQRATWGRTGDEEEA
jgi:hypothetical protein